MVPEELVQRLIVFFPRDDDVSRQVSPEIHLPTNVPKLEVEIVLPRKRK
jgi:hypothetical protein